MTNQAKRLTKVNAWRSTGMWLLFMLLGVLDDTPSTMITSGSFLLDSRAFVSTTERWSEIPNSPNQRLSLVSVPYLKQDHTYVCHYHQEQIQLYVTPSPWLTLYNPHFRQLAFKLAGALLVKTSPLGSLVPLSIFASSL